jgi:hypothetical protein
MGASVQPWGRVTRLNCGNATTHLVSHHRIADRVTRQVSVAEIAAGVGVDFARMGRKSSCFRRGKGL